MMDENDARDKTELKLMQEELMREIHKKPQFVGSIPECIGGIKPDHVKGKEVMNAIIKEVSKHTIPNGNHHNQNKRVNGDPMELDIEDPKPPKKPPKDEQAVKKQKVLVVPGYDERLWGDVEPEFIFKQYLIYHTMCVIQPDYEGAVTAAQHTDAGKRTMRILDAIKCLASAMGARTGSQVNNNAFQIMQRTIQLVSFPKIDKLEEIMECSISKQKTKKGQAYMMVFIVKTFDEKNKTEGFENLQRVMNEEWMSFFVNWSLLNLRDVMFRAHISKRVKVEKATNPNIPNPSLASAVVIPSFIAECMKLFKKPLCYFFTKHCTAAQRIELAEHFGEQWFSITE